MIFVGIDDTDSPDSRGTNQLARALVQRVASRCECVSIVRHQLLFDPRVPYTSKNGSASIRLRPLVEFPDSWLIDELRSGMREDFIPGSDPGLCVTRHVPRAITEFGWRCQRDVVTQQDARELAGQHGIHLEGLGGTEGGVIGALAAVGLVVTENDGRIVQLGEWPDDLEGSIEIERLHERGLVILGIDDEQEIATGTVEVGKHLRPNLQRGRVVLFVRAAIESTADWEAVRVK